MRYLILFLVITIMPLFSEENYFKSNKSGMLLEKIDRSETGEYYIHQNKDTDNWTINEKFYSSDDLKTDTISSYSPNFSRLIKVVKVEGPKKKIDYYSEGRIDSSETYRDSELRTIEKYIYNESSLLVRLDLMDSDEEIIYSDYYYRNRDGSLRRIHRTSDEGYQNYWYYKDGSISEFWHIIDNTKIVTSYNEDGEVYRKKGFIDELLSYEENLTYTEDGILLKSVKVKDNIEEEKYYNKSGLVSEFKILENGLLTRKHLYSYQGDSLIKETINGHGKKEEILFTLDTEGEPVLTSYYENDKLIKNVIDEGDNLQIIEYFKDENIFLKEFMDNGEKVKTEYYLDGVLFKSESISE